MLEQQFRDECAKLGVDINNLENNWAYYQAVYLEMTQGGEKKIKVTEYHNRVSGQNRVAKAAFKLLEYQSTPIVNVE